MKRLYCMKDVYRYAVWVLVFIHKHRHHLFKKEELDSEIMKGGGERICWDLFKILLKNVDLSRGCDAGASKLTVLH